jgi:GTP-binding protein
MRENNGSSVVVQNAEFLFGAPHLTAIRRVTGPEVAVVGRSNVGKSSFINRLSGRKLARVSSRPGATTELNYYKMAGLAQGKPFALNLVDMPGFGFAKLSKQEREHISHLTVSFLRERERLRAMILLNDCRREPQDDELAVQRLCAEEGRHLLVVLTKFDTLRKNDQKRAVEGVAKAYHLEAGDVLVTGEKISPALIWERIVTLL